MQYRSAHVKNLINALKLLANQQEDGDGPFQSVVSNFCEGSRKGLAEGLRNFIKVDNHCALDVGHLKPSFINQERYRGVDAESSGSWLPESVHQC